jgi:hypothetical protein
VLYGLPNYTIQRLQILQNRAAKVVLKWKPRDSSIEALKLLHWLPVYFRIKFKIACIVFKCLNESDSPSYLQDTCMLCLKRTAYNTRSIDTEAKTLLVPAVKRKTFASRSFAIAGPIVWNELPNNVRTITYSDFKWHLIAFFFTTAFYLVLYMWTCTFSILIIIRLIVLLHAYLLLFIYSAFDCIFIVKLCALLMLIINE